MKIKKIYSILENIKSNEMSLVFSKTVSKGLFCESRREIEPKEIRSCFISFLLVVFTKQLEILVKVHERRHTGEKPLRCLRKNELRPRASVQVKSMFTLSATLL